ncbi:MAG: exopolysaccharide biosynthesis protein [Rhodobacterales bacterium]|nr:MAG: exopolysaccharide biosynthesis protein [Rhodobacterales bacterium]
MRDLADQQDLNLSSEYVSERIIGLIRPARQSLYARHGKRVLDLLLTTLLLTAAAPLIGLFYLIVRLDGGPGFYAQPRIGRDGREFPCFKLRTMMTGAEAELDRLCREDPALAQEWLEHQKLTNDPRITPIGRFLRASSLDELPQLFNVLRGEMSLVGPRPFTPDQNDLYWQAGGRAYYRQLPGLTGPWQVSDRGENSFLGRIAFDEAYEANLSLRQDLSLLLQTIGAVIRRTGR